MDKPRQLPSLLFQRLQVEQETCWRPSADVYRTRTGWLLKFDVAGVRPDDVAVAIEGRRITVSGIRRDCVAEEAEAYYSMEIAYNRFERTVELPCHLRKPRVTLEGRDGLLIVRVTEG